MRIRHLACLSLLIATVALAGCNRDEAKAKVDCDKAPKATECTGKQATETNLGGLAKAVNK